jgi:peroxiredoxin family protein
MTRDSSPAVPADLEALVDAAVHKRLGAVFADLEHTVAGLKASVEQLKEACPEDRCTIVAFSGDMDRLFAALTIASGAAAMGMESSMFFTFWGLSALKVKTTYAGKSVGQKMAAMMLPGGPGSVPTSRMNMAGMGPVFFKMLMKQKNVQSLPQMMEMVQELGVRIVACEMSMGVMGMSREELLPGIDYGGVATYLGDASRSKVTLFI